MERPVAAPRPQTTDPLTADIRGVELPPSNAVISLRELGAALEWRLDPTRHAFTLGAGLPHQVDVSIPRQYVSRLHATLRRDGFWLEVRNASPNGTYFGGSREERAPVRAGDTFTVGQTTLLALDEFMVTARRALQRQLGRDAHVEVDAALVAITRRQQPPLVLTGPAGGEPERLARAIHAASPRRELGFELVDPLATRPAMEAALARAGNGTVFVELRALHDKHVSAALAHGLFGASVQARAIVAAPSLERALAAFDTRRIGFDEIASPPLASRSREIVELLDLLMIEQGSAARASQRPVDRLAAMARYGWPGNQDELRKAAVRIDAYLAAGCNLSAAARSLGIHHSTLAEQLERIGAIARRGAA